MTTVSPSQQTDAVNRRAPSDLWLWLVVLLPTISAAMAFYKLQGVGLFMTVFGLAALECGRLADAKFMQVVARYLACGLVTAVVYIGLQFAIDYVDEPAKTPFAGSMGDYGAIAWTPIPLWTKIRIHSFYCVTCGLLLAAGLTREVRPVAQLGLCSVLGLFVYPIFVAWSWGGGRLFGLGFHDFAGGTVVYSLAGWSALAVLAVRGWLTRRERAGHQYLTNNHRPWLYLCGATLLSPVMPVIGIFGFIAPFDFSKLVAAVFLAAASGAIAASLIAVVFVRAWRMQFAFVGGWAAVAALTAVPGPPLVGSFTDSLLIGIAAGSLSMISLWCVDKLGVPDHLGVVSACGVGGATGTIAVGLLNLAPGTLFQPATLATQLIGVGTAMVWAFGVFGGITWAAIYLVRRRTRVSTANERTATQFSGE